jgi:hypothetical protein
MGSVRAALRGDLREQARGVVAVLALLRAVNLSVITSFRSPHCVGEKQLRLSWKRQTALRPPYSDRRTDHELRRSIDDYREKAKQLKERAEASKDAAAREECLRLAQGLVDLADALQDSSDLLSTIAISNFPDAH